MSDTREPTMAEAIGQAMDARIARIHTGMPARVEKIDFTANTVDVQPVLMDAIETTDGVEVDPFPQITSVPIGIYRGGPAGAQAFVSLPIAVGNYVWLHSASRSIDQWLTKGGIVDPIDLRRHDINDVYAYPGVYPSAETLSDVDPSNLVIGFNGGAQIHITPSGEVHLVQKNPSDAISLASKSDARFAAIESALSAAFILLIAHVHTSAAPGSPTSPSPTLAALSAPSGSSTASAKVKAV